MQNRVNNEDALKKADDIIMEQYPWLTPEMSADDFFTELSKKQDAVCSLKVLPFNINTPTRFREVAGELALRSGYDGKWHFTMKHSSKQDFKLDSIRTPLKAFLQQLIVTKIMPDLVEENDIEPELIPDVATVSGASSEDEYRGSITKSEEDKACDQQVAHEVDIWIKSSVMTDLALGRYLICWVLVTDIHLLAIYNNQIGVLPINDVESLRQHLMVKILEVLRNPDLREMPSIPDVASKVIHDVIKRMPPQWFPVPFFDGRARPTVIASSGRIFYKPHKKMIPRGTLWVCDER